MTILAAEQVLEEEVVLASPEIADPVPKEGISGSEAGCRPQSPPRSGRPCNKKLASDVHDDKTSSFISHTEAS